jgi:diguanylate cyclase (GGDEF)-like protein
VIVLLAYAAVLVARIPATFFSPTLDDGSLLSGVSFALITFGTLLFTVVIAFLLLNMTKERTELQHKINAMVDPLSGVANRRGFLDGARRLLAQQATDGEPLAMMLFDLDRFKDVNDRMGHAVGDRVLQTFATSSTLTLGADILFGRIGGEEFAALCPVGDLGEAYAVADRVRRNFAVAAQRFANGNLEPTVSVGVAIAVNPGLEAGRNANDSSKDPATSTDLLLEVADRALYRAKANGRNRVEATAPLDESITPFVGTPSIVPLIKAERARSARPRGWRRSASY